MVSSTGPAAEYQGCCLGVYEQEEGEHEGAPYYRQKHDTGVPQDSFLYRWDQGGYCTPPRTGDIWCISPTLGWRGGAMKCPANGSLTPPDQGWLVYDGAKYIPDSTLRFSTTPYSWCPELTVGISGAAGERWPGYQGRYLATSRNSCGRKVRGVFATSLTLYFITLQQKCTLCKSG